MGGEAAKGQQDGAISLKYDRARSTSSRSSFDEMVRTKSWERMGKGAEAILLDTIAASRAEVEDETTDAEVDADFNGGWCYINWKTLWAFIGPGWLMSIAYLDPGNLESDLQAGAYGGFDLIWVLFVATFVGLILQILAARLGVVTGRNLAEMCRLEYPRPVSLLLWIMTEIAIIGSDIQEVVGSAIALQVLFGLPLWLGCLITGLDTFTFLAIQFFGVRKLEFFFAFLILIMLVSFWVNFAQVQPGAAEIFGGFVPQVPSYAVTQAVGILGAVIMPHNIYLHSALVQSRKVDRSSTPRIWLANKYFAIESTLALLISFFINLAVVAVFAEGFFSDTCASSGQACVPFPHAGCASDPAFNASIFCTNENGIAGTCGPIGLRSAGAVLGSSVGADVAKIIWGIGLLAAGQSSTMTGTYAGQFVMEGFLEIKLEAWKRVAITRSIALGPAIGVALIGSAHTAAAATGDTCVEHFDTSGDEFDEWLNVLQSIQMPFALLPLLCFTSDRRLMGDFVNPTWLNALCWTLTGWVIGTNIYTAVTQVVPLLEGVWVILAIIVGILYLAFLVAVGWKDFKRAYRSTLLLFGFGEGADEEEALLSSIQRDVAEQTGYGGTENGNGSANGSSTYENPSFR